MKSRRRWSGPDGYVRPWTEALWDGASGSTDLYGSHRWNDSSAILYLDFNGRSVLMEKRRCNYETRSLSDSTSSSSIIIDVFHFIERDGPHKLQPRYVKSLRRDPYKLVYRPKIYLPIIFYNLKFDRFDSQLSL